MYGRAVSERIVTGGFAFRPANVARDGVRAVDEQNQRQQNRRRNRGHFLLSYKRT